MGDGPTVRVTTNGLASVGSGAIVGDGSGPGVLVGGRMIDLPASRSPASVRPGRSVAACLHNSSAFVVSPASFTVMPYTTSTR